MVSGFGMLGVNVLLMLVLVVIGSVMLMCVGD